MWHPDAIRKPIPPGANDPPIIPIGMIFHVRDGEGSSLYPYFNGPSGGIESHLYTRYDGTLEQYRDSSIEADANYLANSFVRNGKRYGFISVETEGLENGRWSGQQMARNFDLIAWGHAALNIPLQVCSGPYSPGFGFHTMFDEWVPGGKDSKTCPGPIRKQQFRDDMVPYIESGETLVNPGQFWAYWNKRIEKRGDAYSLLRRVADLADDFSSRLLNTRVALHRNAGIDYGTQTHSTVGSLLARSNLLEHLIYHKVLLIEDKVDAIAAKQNARVESARTLPPAEG